MLEKHEVQRLLDLAFFGFQNGKGKLSREIIEGLDQLLEESVELEICRAMGFYTIDEFEKARQVLENALGVFPDNSMVRIYMALVDILEEKSEDAREKILNVIEKDDDPEAVALGKTFLKELV